MIKRDIEIVHLLFEEEKMLWSVPQSRHQAATTAIHSGWDRMEYVHVFRVLKYTINKMIADEIISVKLAYYW